MVPRNLVLRFYALSSVVLFFGLATVALPAVAGASTDRTYSVRTPQSEVAAIKSVKWTSALVPLK
jgi:hypothetical protein